MQGTFKRYEKKYIITKEQFSILEPYINKHMIGGKYGKYMVQNIYYDTKTWDVVQRSIEKPHYKEKMRVRCYGIPKPTDNIFVELKKKYAGIVYKRRITTSYSNLNKLKSVLLIEGSQISKELSYYMQHTNVDRMMYISYLRQEFAGKEDVDLRITFDRDVTYRLDTLDFNSPQKGKKILPDIKILMEVKTHTAYPLWLAQVFSNNKIFSSSFSKYGASYLDYIHYDNESEVKRFA